MLSTFRRAGLFHRVASSRFRRERLLILCYHGVALSDEDEWNSDMFVSQRRLRERLLILKQWDCSVLPLAEAIQRLQSGTLPPRSVCLTFDDGNVDFAERALPVLREFGYPSTVYWTTFYAGRGEPVFPFSSAYIAWKSRAESCTLEWLTGAPTRVFHLRSHDERAALSHALGEYAHAHGLSTAEKTDVLARLAAHLRVDFADVLASRVTQIMSAEQAKWVAAHGVDVQLHTHRHRTPADRQLFLREIEDNRRVIRETLGRTADHFCYPSGVTSEAFLPWLAEAEVRTATTCVPGLAHAASPPFLLPRWIDTGTASADEFVSWVSGVGTLFPALKRSLSWGQR